MRREKLNIWVFLVFMILLVMMLSGCGSIDYIEVGGKYDFVGDGNPVEGILKIGINPTETAKEERPVLDGEIDGKETKFYAFTEDETAVIMQSLEKNAVANPETTMSVLSTLPKVRETITAKLERILPRGK